MSGGVDSSVAAALLLEQGYEVIGIMLHIWSESHITNKCCSLQATEDAREIAAILGIPFYIRNYQEFFKEQIVNYFLNASQNGYTPNPCFFCNQKVRFGRLLAESLKLNADYLATGHYARISQKNQEFQLLKAKDKTKDQSYMLHRLGQKQLAHSLFPLGELLKQEVREIARIKKFPIFQKKDSQDLCFLGQDGVKGFLHRQCKEKMQEGAIINTSGKLLGKHNGLMAYTIGQRRGLGISAEQPLFVIGKNHKKNQLIVGFHKQRVRKSFWVEDYHFVNGKIPQEQMLVSTKIRYQSTEKNSWICYQKNKLQVNFLEMVNDIAPGQGAVFYQGEKLLGGGIIAKEL